MSFGGSKISHVLVYILQYIGNVSLNLSGDKITSKKSSNTQNQSRDAVTLHGTKNVFSALESSPTFRKRYLHGNNRATLTTNCPTFGFARRSIGDTPVAPVGCWTVLRRKRRLLACRELGVREQSPKTMRRPPRSAGPSTRIWEESDARFLRCRWRERSGVSRTVARPGERRLRWYVSEAGTRSRDDGTHGRRWKCPAMVKRETPDGRGWENSGRVGRSVAEEQIRNAESFKTVQWLIAKDFRDKESLRYSDVNLKAP